MRQRCPLCKRRLARRACPALDRRICAYCCGTKRLAEINCPSDCSYLASSQAHPPASVQRQQERDTAFMFSALQELAAPQHKLFLLIQSFLRRTQLDADTMLDNDVALAMRALAETYETASRGIIYEHVSGLPGADRLSANIRTLIGTTKEEGLTVSDADIAVVLRRIEQAARHAKSVLPGENGVLELAETDPS